MRDDFPVTVKDLLAKRVGLICSRPGCRQVTAGPQMEAEGVINVGVAAHITAASPDGPRYDPALTPEQRRSSGNGLWLCQTCAKLIDSDTERYTVQTLREWRRSAEAEAFQTLEHRPEPPPAGPFPKLERLIPELLAEMRADLKRSPLKRKCVLLKRAWSYTGDGTEFSYYHDEHKDLESQFHVLENHGYVFNISTAKLTKYRFSEELVDYLVGSRSDGRA